MPKLMNVVVSHNPSNGSPFIIATDKLYQYKSGSEISYSTDGGTTWQISNGTIVIPGVIPSTNTTEEVWDKTVLFKRVPRNKTLSKESPITTTTVRLIKRVTLDYSRGLYNIGSSLITHDGTKYIIEFVYYKQSTIPYQSIIDKLKSSLSGMTMPYTDGQNVNISLPVATRTFISEGITCGRLYYGLLTGFNGNMIFTSPIFDTRKIVLTAPSNYVVLPEYPYTTTYIGLYYDTYNNFFKSSDIYKITLKYRKAGTGKSASWKFVESENTIYAEY